MSAQPPIVVNITIPVLNRLDLTQLTLLSLHKSNRTIPFSVTVVDNNSDEDLQKCLTQFKQDGIIDNLFFLPQNMGIACACNIGWQCTDAPYYLKLDNDILIKRPDWLERLFALWAHGKPLSTFGPSHQYSDMIKEPGFIETNDGVLGICTTNLAGQCLFVPKVLSDLLGYWNEDYGLYGAEDGDYGLRMCCAGLPQYYYHAEPYIRDLGHDPDLYTKRGLDKQKEWKSVFVDEKGGIGLFVLNAYLYDMCIRNWAVPLRYEIADINGRGVVTVVENKDYAAVRTALQYSKKMLDEQKRTGKPDDIFAQPFIAMLKNVWDDCGQGYAPLA